MTIDRSAAQGLLPFTVVASALLSYSAVLPAGEVWGWVLVVAAPGLLFMTLRSFVEGRSSTAAGRRPRGERLSLLWAATFGLEGAAIYALVPRLCDDNEWCGFGQGIFGGLYLLLAVVATTSWAVLRLARAWREEPTAPSAVSVTQPVPRSPAAPGDTPPLPNVKEF